MVEKIKNNIINRNLKSKKISGIRKIYIKYFTGYIDSPNKETADMLESGSLTVTNLLTGRYKENNFIIKSSAEIDTNRK